MLVAIDIGNTNMVFGLFKNDFLIKSFRTETKKNLKTHEFIYILDEFIKIIKIEKGLIKKIIVSSVVPELYKIIVESTKSFFNIEAKFINILFKSNIKIMMENPSELGTDRFANCVGAYNLYKSPIIIVDYGTANKYDFVNNNGEFRTGITSPGVMLRVNSLSAKTSLLKDVELEFTNSIIATNTTTSIQAGIFFGILGETEYIINKLKKEFGNDLKIVGTGGYINLFKDYINYFDYINMDLTLQGLKILNDLNN